MTRRPRPLPAAAGLAALALAACAADPVAPRAAPPAAVRAAGTAAAPPATAAALFARYVAVGTSNSQGVQSAGVFAAGQRAAWPAQLAARVGAPFTLPLVRDPGCGPPLLPPLAANVALLEALRAFGGHDPVGFLAAVCAPNAAGVTLPANNVAISGADVRDAVATTPELAAARSPRVGALYRRVLLPGQTQLTAMLAQRPTFVSVELAANDVLPAATGRVDAMTPYASWQRDFDQVLDGVQSTGAGAVLVGLPADAANFPTVRRAREFFLQGLALRPLGITVSASCYFSPNALFVPGYLLSLVERAPVTATCADTPGAADFVLTPADVAAVNARMAQMNAHMQAEAARRGYAYFTIGAIYDRPKPAFDLLRVLFTASPFGGDFSLDGVHPSAAGQQALAEAAARAVAARYGVTLP